MTDKKPKPEILKVMNKWCHNWDTAYKDWNFPEDRPLMITKKELEKLATIAYEQGKLDQYNQTIALLYNLRTNRFIYNDEMKLTIDMIKDEITRRLKSQIKTQGAK